MDVECHWFVALSIRNGAMKVYKYNINDTNDDDYYYVNAHAVPMDVWTPRNRRPVNGSSIAGLKVYWTCHVGTQQ